MTSPFDDAAVALEAVVVSSYKALAHLVHRGTRSPHTQNNSMGSVMRAWNVTHGADFGGPVPPSPHTPLWKNPNLLHLYTDEDPIVWTRYGVKKLGDITQNGVLRTFDGLKSAYRLSNTQYFRYIQLQYAYRSQFGCAPVPFALSGLESMLRDEDLVKPICCVQIPIPRNYQIA